MKGRLGPANFNVPPAAVTLVGRPTMLALSRRPGERVVFPSLNITVEVLQVKGNGVRLGIDAPPEVGIFREEIAPATGTGPPPADAKLPALNHAQRNQLNAAVLSFHVAEKQLQAGLIAEAEKTLQHGLKILKSLDQAVGQARNAAETKPDSKTIEALVVEDDPLEESLLTNFLRLSGFRVETARDGYEALDYLASHRRPDFVLLDMRLPRLNGAATITAIRNNPALTGLRIFAVTGVSQNESGVATGPTGVDRWFQKPLNPSLLAEAMNALGTAN
jgi:carbon storage regulator CsrA